MICKKGPEEEQKLKKSREKRKEGKRERKRKSRKKEREKNGELRREIILLFGRRRKALFMALLFCRSLLSNFKLFSSFSLFLFPLPPLQS